MSQTIVIKIKDVYGVARAYPVNDSAKIFMELLGNKTFSPDQLEKIKQLGFNIEIEQVNYQAFSQETAAELKLKRVNAK